MKIPFMLAWKNIKRRPARTAGLVVTAAILAFVLFAGFVITMNMENGMKSLNERMGADIMIVPEGYDADMESMLLGGNPQYFYLDASAVDKASQIKGVEKVTAQFYLISSSQSCCDAAVQFIGIDPETDFIVKPWISQSNVKEIGYGDLIVGSDINLRGKDTIRFYGRDYTVAAQLARTGVGMDNSVYATMETIRDMYEAAKEKGFSFPDGFDPEHSVSAVMVKLADGASKAEAEFYVGRRIKGVQTIIADDVVNRIGGSMKDLAVYIRAMQIFVLLFSVITLSTQFSVTVRERRMEFAMLRAVGASRAYTGAVVFAEALIICVSGAVCGAAAGAAAVFPFSVYIGDAAGLPYVSVSMGGVLLLLLSVTAITVLAGTVSSVRAAASTGRAELYLTMRDDD